jgi:hypothetical protein
MTATAFLVFYRFKAMNKEETEKSKDEWNRLKNGLPSGIELEADNADSFLDWWSKFKNTIRWYVEETHTIVARRR